MVFDGMLWLDLLLLPALFFVVLRDIVAGRNWRNLIITVLLAMLTALNVLYHTERVPGRTAVGDGVVLVHRVGYVRADHAGFLGPWGPVYSRKWRYGRWV